jgi:hypothetical protein
MGAACAARLVGGVGVLILADRNADAVASVTTNVSGFVLSRSDSVPLVTCGFVSGLDGVKTGQRCASQP